MQHREFLCKSSKKSAILSNQAGKRTLLGRSGRAPRALHSSYLAVVSSNAIESDHIAEQRYCGLGQVTLCQPSPEDAVIESLEHFSDMTQVL